MKRGAIVNKFSLRNRIFFALLLVVAFTAATVGVITFLHFREMSKTFHKNRLLRKETTIIETIDYAITDYPEEVNSNNIKDVLESKIFEFSDINDIHINIYSLKGNLLLSSEAKISKKRKKVPTQVLKILSPADDRVEVKKIQDEQTYINTYSYIYNINHKPIAIISLPYLHDNSYQKDEFFSLLERFFGVALFISLIGIIISWWLSKSITSRINEIAQRLTTTHVIGYNKPLFYDGNDEISILVNSYNDMVLKLNEQSELLVKIEREETWREAARQVAHELKNPLTPMRLQIQAFNLRFDPNNPDIKEKVKELCQGLIKQIDTISGIAEAFSDFTKMPIRKDKTINIIKEIEVSLEVFDKNYVKYTHNTDCIEIYFDPNYLVRVITNLVKNALQSVPSKRTPEVNLRVHEENDYVFIEVQDNGTGIPDHMQSKIFEPKFTTKSSGSGLGLPMVKKIIEEYNGSIRFKNNPIHGSTFIITLPKDS